MSNSSKFYVYKVLGKNGELLYIGKGSGDRYKTHTCGVSSNRNINRYFFNNGEDGCLTSLIIDGDLSNNDATLLERTYINAFVPYFNIHGYNLNEKDIDYAETVVTLYSILKDESITEVCGNSRKDIEEAYYALTKLNIISMIIVKSIGIQGASEVNYNLKRIKDCLDSYLQDKVDGISDYEDNDNEDYDFVLEHQNTIRRFLTLR